MRKYVRGYFVKKPRRLVGLHGPEFIADSNLRTKDADQAHQSVASEEERFAVTTKKSLVMPDT